MTNKSNRSASHEQHGTDAGNFDDPETQPARLLHNVANKRQRAPILQHQFLIILAKKPETNDNHIYRNQLAYTQRK